MLAESLENRLMLTSAWQNLAAPLDVNHDEHITPGDVLSVVNFLNQNGPQELPEKSEGEAGNQPHSVDVNGDGSASASDVLAVINYLNGEGENGAVLQYRIAIFDATGTTEIETVGLGQEFIVKVFVQDIRMAARAGVFSAYLDINYDAALASVVPEAFTQLDLVTFETVAVTIMDNQDDYGQGRSGDATTTAGVIDGAGSFASSIAPLGPTERELLKFKMRATGEGTVTFAGSPTTEAVGDAGQSPLLDSGLYNQDESVCPSQAQEPCRGEMMFLDDSITIVTDIVAVADSVMLNEDSGASSPINVLGNDVANVGTVNLDSFTLPSNGQLVRNGDDTFTYTPDLNFFGSDSFDYTIENGEGATSDTTVTITVDPVNDGPINSVPGAQVINEDSALVLSGGVISVADVDADAGGGLEVSLGVSSGVLTVGTTAATVTGDGTTAVSIDGSVAAVNAALNGLTYTPNPNFNGSDSLSVSTSDQGNFGSGGALSDNDTISITIDPVNDAPVNTVPGPQTVFNTTTLSLGSIQVSDVDAQMLEVNLTVSEGVISLGSTAGVDVTGNDSASLVTTGSVAAINSALGTLVYDPEDSFIGNDTLTVTTSDLGGTGAGGELTDTDTVALTVTPPEVPFAASDLFSIEEDSANTSLDVLGNDLRPDPVGANTLTITQLNEQPVSEGQQLTTGNGGTITFSSNSFSYEPAAEFFGTDTFTYTIESSPAAGDGPSTGTVTIEVLPINDGPVNSLPGSQTIDEDSTLSFSGVNEISVADIDAGGAGVTVMLSVDNGTLDVSSTGGGTVTENDAGNVLTLAGTVSQINTRLGGLIYTPNSEFAGLDTLTVDTNDNGNTGGAAGDPAADNPLADIDTVQITIQPINDAPVVVVPGAQSFIADFDNQFSAANGNALSVSDSDAGEDDVRLDLTFTEGSLTVLDPSGLSVTGNGSNSVSLLGSITEINSALATGLNYRTSNSGDKTLSATINDLGNNGGIAGDPTANNPLLGAGTVSVDVLAFVPSTIGGFVFLDANGNGVRDSERGLEGVRVTLSGVDAITGNEIEPIIVETSADGSYAFMNLRPGTYRLSKAALPHFLEGAAHFENPVLATGDNDGAVDIDMRGGVNSLGNYFPVLGLNGTFFDGLSHLTPYLPPDGELYDNLLFAIDATNPANTATVVSYQGRWGGYDNARIVLAPDGQSAEVTVRDQQTGTDMSTTVTFDSGRLRVRSIGALTTVRIFMSPQQMAAAAFAQAVDQIVAE